MSTAGKIRSNIIGILSKIDDIKTLESMYFELMTKLSTPEKKIPSFMEAVKPVRQHIDLDEIIQSQNYRPISYQEFRENADGIEWNESLEELLDALQK